MTRASWFANSFVEDLAAKAKNPPPEEGDGRVYIVRDIFGNYLAASAEGSGWSSWTDRKASAKRFFHGQAAWGAASKSIYPAEVIVVRGKAGK